LRPGFAPGFFFEATESQISGISALKKTSAASWRRGFYANWVARFASLLDHSL
jgi:hypothetical protein